MKLIGQILFPIIIIALGFAGFKALKSSKPDPKSKKAKVVIPLVDITEVSPQDHTPPVISYGTVQSYFETTLTPQITGEIVEVSQNFRVGMMVKEGDVLARIDDTDYKATLATLTANKTTAQQVLAEEEILAKQASEDWVASGRSLSKASDFVLRKPQLAAAKANVQSAEAAEQKAQTDIERAIIRAPYDAMVLERSASLGNLATPQQSLGRLVATERAEIRLPLTAVQLTQVDLTTTATGEINPIDIVLTSPTRADAQWSAKLVRVEAEVDQENQVTYVIAEIDQPYTGHDQPMSIGTFVNASIPAKPIKDSYAVNEAALVNDHFVWALDADNRLLRLSAERMQSFDAQVYLNIETQELEPPLRLVTRPLTNFKNGNKVKPTNANGKATKTKEGEDSKGE